MNIRLVKSSSDISKIVSLANVIFNDYYKEMLGEDETSLILNNFYSDTCIRRHIKDGIEYYFINDNKEDIGFIALRYRPAFIYIPCVYIIEAERDKKVFDVVLQIIKSIAFKSDYKSIRLSINVKNTLAMDIFEHIGFVKLYTKVNELGIEEYVYELKLHY